MPTVKPWVAVVVSLVWGLPMSIAMMCFTTAMFKQYNVDLSHFTSLDVTMFYQCQLGYGLSILFACGLMLIPVFKGQPRTQGNYCFVIGVWCFASLVDLLTHLGMYQSLGINMTPIYFSAAFIVLLGSLFLAASGDREWRRGPLGHPLYSISFVWIALLLLGAAMMKLNPAGLASNYGVNLSKEALGLFTIITSHGMANENILIMCFLGASLWSSDDVVQYHTVRLLVIWMFSLFVWMCSAKNQYEQMGASDAVLFGQKCNMFLYAVLFLLTVRPILLLDASISGALQKEISGTPELGPSLLGSPQMDRPAKKWVPHPISG